MQQVLRQPGITADATGAGRLRNFIDVSGWTVPAGTATLIAVLGTKTYTITIDTAESATSKAALSLSSS